LLFNALAAAPVASSSGRPSTRVVGIKGFDRSGFKIATNGNSVKAKQMVSYVSYSTTITSKIYSVFTH